VSNHGFFIFSGRVGTGVHARPVEQKLDSKLSPVVSVPQARPLLRRNAMFAGLEPVHDHVSRRWTAAVSFTSQAALVAAALVIPLLTPQNLPEALVRRRIFVPMSTEEPSVKPMPGGHIGAISTITPLLVNRDAARPFTYSRSQDGPDAGPPSFSILPEPSGGPGGIPGSIGNGIAPVIPHAVAVVNHTRISAMMQGNLIKRVEPQYPAIAKQAGIQGSVIIRAIISREGNIERTELLSGHPLLSRAALEAVRQWKYRPYYLNNAPVEVETQITVNFVLNR
jgi:protein TonB